MALLDHQVPEEAHNITLELLQQCVGSICIVKFRREGQPLAVVACGMVTSVGVPDNKDAAAVELGLSVGLEHDEAILGANIEYIYTFDVIPGAGEVSSMMEL